VNIKSKCLQCGIGLIIDITREGEGYFFGFDTDYYGCGLDDMKDPHEVIGYYCKKCGDELRNKSELIGYQRIS
jgi:hypothetical protein